MHILELDYVWSISTCERLSSACLFVCYIYEALIGDGQQNHVSLGNWKLEMLHRM